MKSMTKSKKYLEQQKLLKARDTPKSKKNSHIFYIRGKHITRSYQMQEKKMCMWFNYTLKENPIPSKTRKQNSE